jgi:hypothetical protein
MQGVEKPLFYFVIKNNILLLRKNLTTWQTQN